MTDLGRQKIARNDGSFRIVGYTFGDDEIDYSLYDPSSTSELVDQDILNTPIFEANINENLALNHPLMIITNPNLKYLPKLSSDNASVQIGEEKGASAGVTLRFYQDTNLNAKIVPVEIQDTSFRVELFNDFLHIENQTPVDVTPYGTGIYIIQRDLSLIQSSQASQATFKIRVQSLTNSTWNTFGEGSAPNRTITTKVKVTGLNSGLSATSDVVVVEEFKRV